MTAPSSDQITPTFLIYGANGYTGALIAREAVARGLSPILAGRSASKLEPLARELGLRHRAAALDDAEALARALEGVGVVIHCAGPFAATAATMIDACLSAKVHYTDITGEVAVFEMAQTRDAEARAESIVLCPGVGFDVVPSDCLAARLARELPDAIRLRLGFQTASQPSPGTAKTIIEGMALGGRVRKDGKIVAVPHAYRTRRIDFGNGETLAVTIPWGDVSSAYHSTAIGDIEVYTASSPAQIRAMKVGNVLGGLLGSAPVQGVLMRQASRRVRGPSAEQRDSSPTYVWGEVENAAGERVVGRLRTANGYSVTVAGALAIAELLLSGTPRPGYHTPSTLGGPELVTQLAGSSEVTIERFAP